MSHSRRGPRRSSSRIAAAAAVAGAILGLGALPAAPARAAPAANSVTVNVLSVSPASPKPSSTAQPLAVVLQLVNTTGVSFGKLTVQADRGDPIQTRSALDSAIASPHAPDPSLTGSVLASSAPPITTALLPAGSATVTVRTTSEIPTDEGLCICANAIYPLYFSIHYTDPSSGNDDVVGAAQTYLPVFKDVPQPIQVSWLWPLLERPHRSISDTVFTDDGLAASVAGGRLDRLLSVAEAVGAAHIPLTLVVDPELIDELAVMASQPYQVETTADHTVPGTGAADAEQWLARLRAVLDADPGVTIATTAVADPAVESLQRNGLQWSTSLSQAAQNRVTAALGGHEVRTDVSWPTGEQVSPETLSSLVRQGTHTVVLNDTALPGGAAVSPTPDALAPVQTDAGPATAAVTSAPIERYVGQAVSGGGPGLAALPELVSEIAVNAVEDPTRSHFVVVTPPRYLDPDVTSAIAAITSTSRSTWSAPIGLEAAAQTITPVDHGRLATQFDAPELPGSTLGAAQYLATTLPGLASLFVSATDADKQLSTLPAGIQRSESAAWIDDPAGSVDIATRVQDKVAAVAGGVRLVVPTTGTYTLGSADSPLPITIDNTLDVQVQVRVRVSAVGNLPGFTADDIGVQKISPVGKLPLHIPVHVVRAGRIRVEVQLLTPDYVQIGSSLPLSVRSTALGEIGKIITFLAAGVLAVALLVRVIRRLRRSRRAAQASNPPRPMDTVP